MLKRAQQFPAQMWYPRSPSAQPFAYHYRAPAATTDGLPVGTLQGTGLGPALLMTMGTHPDIDSVLMGKSGLLYLQQGKWQGQQVLPASWVQASLAPHSVVWGVQYGYLWWLKYLNANGTRYEGAMAQGNGGQRIAIWPAQQLVVVVTGGSYNQQSAADELLAKYILPAYSQPQPAAGPATH